MQYSSLQFLSLVSYFEKVYQQWKHADTGFVRVFSVLYIASRKAFTRKHSQKWREGGSRWAKDSRQIFSKVSILSKLLAAPILTREVAFWSFFSLVLYSKCFFLSSDVWQSDRSYSNDLCPWLILIWERFCPSYTLFLTSLCISPLPYLFRSFHVFVLLVSCIHFTRFLGTSCLVHSVGF